MVCRTAAGRFFFLYPNPILDNSRSPLSLSDSGGREERITCSSGFGRSTGWRSVCFWRSAFPVAAASTAPARRARQNAPEPARHLHGNTRPRLILPDRRTKVCFCLTPTRASRGARPIHRRHRCRRRELSPCRLRRHGRRQSRSPQHHRFRPATRSLGLRHRLGMTANQPVGGLIRIWLPNLWKPIGGSCRKSRLHPGSSSPSEVESVDYSIR